MQFQIDEAIEILARTPAVLDALLRGKSAVWLNCRKSPDAFSPIDVMGHLMHLETVDWLPRIRMILDRQDGRTFEPFDRFGFQHLIAGKPVGDLLDAFAGQRRQSLATLRDLAIQGQHLDLPGTHPEFGPVTLSNLLATWAVHDLGHIDQIVRTMANEYRDAVGPWRAYLAIID